MTLVFLLKQTGGGKPQVGVEYGSDWVAQNWVINLVLLCDCCVIVSAKGKECIENV